MKLHPEPHPRGALGAAAIAALLVFNAVSPPKPALAQVSENERSIVSMSLKSEKMKGGDLGGDIVGEKIPPADLTVISATITAMNPIFDALGNLIMVILSASDPDQVDGYRLAVTLRGGCSVEKSRQLQDDITLALREAEIEGVHLAPRDCVELFAAEQAGHTWDEHSVPEEEISPNQDAVVVLTSVATSGDLRTLAAAAAETDNVHGARITHKGMSVSLQLFMVGSCNADAVDAALEQTKLEAGRMGVDVSFGGRECLYMAQGAGRVPSW